MIVINNLTIYIFIFILGLGIGSFLNCLIWRLKQKQTILGRSYCPRCKKQINWYDNIPILSFIILQGKCRRCKKKISWQYPAVELITGALFVIVLLMNQESPSHLAGQAGIMIHNSLFIIQVLRDLFFVAVLVIIFIYDLRWYLILDIITLPAIVIALIINLYLGFDILNLLLAAVIGGGFFLLQYIISKGKWIGGGDIRLGVLMGVMLGWPQIIVALMIAYILGSIIGVGLLMSGQKKWSSQVPFGTFLSVATIIALLWGGEILEWYLMMLV